MVYIYFGNPNDYQSDNDYDFAIIYKNGHLYDMVSPELLDECIMINVVDDINIKFDDINNVIKNSRICSSKNFHHSN